MPKEEERLKRIRDIMVKHKGKATAISSRDLMSLLGIKEGETFSHTRGLLTKAIRKFSLPVAATNSKPPGYFYIANREELDKYMILLEQRKMEVETRKNIVLQNYQDVYGPIGEEAEE